MRPTDVIIAISTVVMSLAATCFVVTANRSSRSLYQLLANRSQIGLAAWEETTQTDQQAWLGLPLPAAYPLNKEGGGFAIKVRNFGKTPALAVSRHRLRGHRRISTNSTA